VKQTLMKKTRYLLLENIAREIELMRWQYCLCKSTCQWAHKCPCKGKGRFCTVRCRCKAKSGPCKNRLEGEDSGPSRVQQALLANREALKVRGTFLIIVAIFSLVPALVQSLDDGQKIHS